MIVGGLKTSLLALLILAASVATVPAGSPSAAASTATALPATALSATASDETAEPGGLRQQGMGLVDDAGRPVTLRGINLGGWLNWEAWMWGGLDFADRRSSESHILESLTAAVGPEATEAFRRRMYDAYITEADIARVAELGYNTVRVPINHRAIEDPARPGQLDPAGVAVLDRLFEWATEHEVYVVLDLHAAPGGQSGLYTADPDDVSLWESADNRRRTVELWTGLAGRYGQERWLGGYDLLNEPFVFPTSQLTDLYRDIIAAIRTVDREGLIIAEGNWGAHILEDMTADLGQNLVYSFHAYDFVGRDLEADLARHIAFAQARQRPLYVGEYGQTSLDEIQRWTDVYRSTPEIVGWSPWTWKRTAADGTPTVRTIVPPTSWSWVIIFISLGWSLERLDVAGAMNDFVAAVDLSRTFENTAFVEATR
jgi:hypothetical protein